MVHFPETPWSAVLPVVVGATIVAIAHNQRFALTVGAVLALLVVLQLRGGQAMLLVLLAGGMTAVLQLHEIRTRSKLLVVAAVVAVAVSVMVAATALMGGVPLYPFALVDAAWAAGFALMAGLLVQAALPGIERVFRVATSMTLLEWCDASKPLLKRLAMEAPGTYNHSLQLGTMCEAAAEAIGARGLLARVGAYYHDIGKINKPPYFIENQGASPSKHSKLSPAMSLLIIIGHVKDGLEMAREYGLPPVLHEFIASHHGTTLVQYFYHAATEQRKNHADRAPDEVEFRYPGPKPHSKEVAILMLADAAESSVRAMSDPTPGRIENQVHAMVSRRLMDGQLDMCDLTLKEVHVIEASLVKSLCGIYHGRIAYPTPAGQKPSAAETPGRAPAEAEARNETPEPEGQAQTDEQPGEDKGGPARDEASSPQDPGQEPGERPS
jgi:putative nucleotidyltransferase with HDIG domain